MIDCSFVTYSSLEAHFHLNTHDTILTRPLRPLNVLLVSPENIKKNHKKIESVDYLDIWPDTGPKKEKRSVYIHKMQRGMIETIISTIKYPVVPNLTWFYQYH